jgi:hypothetical protein
MILIKLLVLLLVLLINFRNYLKKMMEQKNDGAVSCFFE